MSDRFIAVSVVQKRIQELEKWARDIAPFVTEGTYNAAAHVLDEIRTVVENARAVEPRRAPTVVRVPVVRLPERTQCAVAGVYILRAAAIGMVKIGYAEDVDKRVRQIMYMSPARLKIFAVQRGATRENERLLHKQLQASRRHGEWFEETEEVRAFLAQIDESVKVTE